MLFPVFQYVCEVCSVIIDSYFTIFKLRNFYMSFSFMWLLKIELFVPQVEVIVYPWNSYLKMNI
jgi:hypothetical protein